MSFATSSVVGIRLGTGDLGARAMHIWGDDTGDMGGEVGEEDLVKLFGGEGRWLKFWAREGVGLGSSRSGLGKRGIGEFLLTWFDSGPGIVSSYLIILVLSLLSSDAEVDGTGLRAPSLVQVRVSWSGCSRHSAASIFRSSSDGGTENWLW